MERKYDLIEKFNIDFGEVRLVKLESGIELYNGADVVKCLAYKDEPKKIISLYCKEPHQVKVNTKQKNQYNIEYDYVVEMTFITRDDVFALVRHSTLPNAVRFKEWIINEVIPSIEYIGAFVLTEALPLISQLSPAQLYEQLNSYQNTIQEQSHIIEAQDEELITYERENKKLDEEAEFYSKQYESEEKFSWAIGNEAKEWKRKYYDLKAKYDEVQSLNNIDTANGNVIDFVKQLEKKIYNQKQYIQNLENIINQHPCAYQFNYSTHKCESILPQPLIRPLDQE